MLSNRVLSSNRQKIKQGRPELDGPVFFYQLQCTPAEEFRLLVTELSVHVAKFAMTRNLIMLDGLSRSEKAGIEGRIHSFIISEPSSVRPSIAVQAFPCRLSHFTCPRISPHADLRLRGFGELGLTFFGLLFSAKCISFNVS
jgi:hypothetical protein